jgi:glycosyltransferase 2 family protein
LKLFARVAVSVLLIAWLLATIEVQNMLTTLSTSRCWLVAIAMGILSARMLLGGLRWQIILEAQNIKRSVLRLTGWYLVGSFFNMFLPTALGGDVARMYQAGKSTRKITDTVVSVMMERIIGCAGLVLLALIALSLPGSALPEGIPAAVAASSVCFVLGLAVIFHPVTSRIAVALLHRLRMSKVGEAITTGHHGLWHLARRRRVLLNAFCVTIVFHLIGVFCVYLTGLSLRLDVPFRFYCVAVPIIWTLTMLPVSINGIGVREGGFLLMFGTAGVSGADAVLLSLLTFFQLTVIGLLGGLVYLFQPLREEQPILSKTCVMNAEIPNSPIE